MSITLNIIRIICDLYTKYIMRNFLKTHISATTGIVDGKTMYKYKQSVGKYNEA